MINYDPLPIKNIMFIWNVILAIFSTCCFKNITLNLIYNDKFLTYESICLDVIKKDEIMIKWVFYFVLSKFPEMIDTVWIVMRKRHVSLLQLWHHFSVSAYCWILVYSPNYNEGGHGVYFAAINSFIHMIMYTYYAIVTKTRFKNNIIATSITVLQIIQMIIGLILHLFKTITCNNNYYLELISGYVIYGSYLYLFVEYFYNRYIKKVK
tara:strand:+ start:352 stop:978 length:627 start_codon:yes stop_codon:yes gene_type:complete